MTKEQIQEKLTAAKQQLEQTVANANMLIGAVRMLEQTLAEWDAPAAQPQIHAVPAVEREA